jgi:hypothetical protein
MPAGMGLQTPAATKVSRKRKRMVDIDELSGDFNVIPKDYEAAWKKLQSRIEEVSIPGRLSTVGLCCIRSVSNTLTFLACCIVSREHLRSLTTL